MYYWDYKGLYILLTDEEEDEIIRSLSDNNPIALIGYNTDYKTRKLWEKKINTHLLNFLLDNHEEFNRKYVFRSWYNEEAQKYFPMFLDAYGRATKLATIGSFDGDELLDDSIESVLLDTNKKIYQISLFNKSIIPKKIPKVNGRISFYSNNIEKIAGTVTNFVLMTKHFNIRFGEKIIRVIMHGK
ncbi:MAG: hypothetical protein KJ666_05565 [Bacteroidetes bacterium]|nr:hypothetical protein [Bacteroidota bacterium]MBU2586240.1 hypothetical protein [Bacteroidota bacterium]